MNDVLNKCVEELAKESPRLDYVRGMLDTLLSIQEPMKSRQIDVTPLPQFPYPGTGVNIPPVQFE